MFGFRRKLKSNTAWLSQPLPVPLMFAGSQPFPVVPTQVGSHQKTPSPPACWMAVFTALKNFACPAGEAGYSLHGAASVITFASLSPFPVEKGYEVSTITTGLL